MVDPKKAADILYKHFEDITTEQFLENLKKYCPEVFEEENQEQLEPSKQILADKNNKKHSDG